MFGAGDCESEVSYLPACFSLQDVGRLQIPVDDVVCHEVFDSLDDLSHDTDGCYLLDPFVSADKAVEISLITIL